MSRVTATMALDARLQHRYRVYVIVTAAALALGMGLGALFTPEQLHFFMPVVVLGGISLTTMFLAGFLVLLEHEERTLTVILVSPVRPIEYIGAKMITLSALALFEGLLIAIAAFGWAFDWLWLIAAILIRALMGTAIGVAVGVRYTSITRFLVPAIGIGLLFDLPVLWYLNVMPWPLMYLWPAMPPMILAKAAFVGVDAWELIYGFVYGCAIVVACVAFARRSLHRYLVGHGA